MPSETAATVLGTNAPSLACQSDGTLLSGGALHGCLHVWGGRRR